MRVYSKTKASQLLEMPLYFTPLSVPIYFLGVAVGVAPDIAGGIALGVAVGVALGIVGVVALGVAVGVACADKGVISCLWCTCADAWPIGTKLVSIAESSNDANNTPHRLERKRAIWLCPFQTSLFPDPVILFGHQHHIC